jgi:hypothetical protein
VYRIDGSLETVHDAVRSAFEAVGINGEHAGESRVDGVVFEGDPASGPSKWVVVDLAESDVETGVTLLSVTVRDLDEGGSRGVAVADSELRARVLDAIAAAADAELVGVDAAGGADEGEDRPEWGPTRWERR